MSNAKERQGLMRDICDNPDDDTPRLVFADWLEDHSDAATDHDWAALIRAQCRLEQLRDREVEDPELQSLQDDAEELKPSVYAALHAGLPVLARGGRIRRGMWALLNRTPAEIGKDAGKIFAKCPVQHLALTNDGRLLERLPQCGHLSRIRSVTTGGNSFDNSRLATLLALPDLTGLRGLWIFVSGLDSGAFEVLARSGRVGGLETLILGGSALSGLGLPRLVDAVAPGHLRELDLMTTPLDDAAIAFLANTPATSALRRLVASTPGIGTLPVAVFAEGRSLGALRSLDLASYPIGASGWQILLGSAAMPELREVGMTFAPGLWEVAPHACRFGKLHPAVQIRVASDVRGSAGSPLIAASGGLSLKNGRDVAEDDWIALFRSPVVSRLWTLSIEKAVLSSKALKALSESPTLGALRRLRLSLNRLPEDGLAALLDGPLLPRLTHLELSWELKDHWERKVDEQMLAAADRLAGLRRLRVNWGWEELQARLGRRVMRWN